MLHSCLNRGPFALNFCGFMLSDLLKNTRQVDNEQVEKQKVDNEQVGLQFTPADAPCVITRYAAVVEHLEVLWRNKNGTDMIKERTKLNKELADHFTATGVVVRQAWISHLRTNKAITFDRAHKVFTATNNLLKRLGGPLIPESALIKT